MNIKPLTIVAWPSENQHYLHPDPLEFKAAGDGSILDDNDYTIFDDETVLFTECLCHTLLVDQLHILTDACILVHNALAEVPAPPYSVNRSRPVPAVTTIGAHPLRATQVQGVGANFSSKHS